MTPMREQSWASICAAAALVAAQLLLSGCAMAPTACPPGLSHAQLARLYFGRNIGSALAVSEADWARFVDEEITPRFPAGFSVADAAGQYRGRDGAIVREPSKDVMILLSGAADEAARLAAIRAAYKERFGQESVLLVESPACAGF
jgi:hypothetical protein